TGAHLVEAERLDLDALGAAAGDRVHADLVVRLAPELPDLWTHLVHDDLRRAVLELRRQAALEHVARLDEVVVDRDHGVLHLERIGLGQEQRGIECLGHDWWPFVPRARAVRLSPSVWSTMWGRSSRTSSGPGAS